MVVYWSWVSLRFVIPSLFRTQLLSLIDIGFAVIHSLRKEGAEPFVTYFSNEKFSNSAIPCIREPPPRIAAFDGPDAGRMQPIA
jgi:hypothetical protein